MDGSIGAREAERDLAALLDRVEQGESLTIKRGGQPIARLVPAEPVAANTADPAAAAARLHALREELRAEGVRVTRDEIRKWIGEGRR